MIRLGDVAEGRDNNLNLLRIVAAAAVLVSHAWPLTLGPGAAEPFEALTGYSLGLLAVMVFFALSGYLVAQSFARAPRAGRFAARRARRILPGLLVSLALAAFVMGPLVTERALSQYLADPLTWRYLGQNGLMLGLQPVLPGVFEANPYPRVAGSIWTLSYEVACYGGLMAAGAAGLLERRRAAWALAAYGTVWLAAPLFVEPLHPRIENLRLLSLPFAVGVALFVWRERVALHPAGLAALALAAALGRGTALYPALLALAIAYGTLLLGFWPARWIRVYNRLGDYSYGLYLYAFPVQGLAVALFGPMGPALNIALALPASLVLAVLSWHLVEAPCLRVGASARGRQAAPGALAPPVRRAG